MSNKTRTQLEPLSELKVFVWRDKTNKFYRVIPVPQKKGIDKE